MQLIGFVGPSYAAKSPNVDVQRTVNLYPELGEVGDEKNQEIASLVGTPGLKPIIGAFVPFIQSSIKPSIELLPHAPVRGFYSTSKDRLFGVTGNVLWELGNTSNYGGTYFGNGDIFIVRGTIGTTVGPVYMSDNGAQLIIVDGQKGYIFDPLTNDLTVIPSEQTPNIEVVAQTATSTPGLAVSATWANPSNALAEDGAFSTQTLSSDTVGGGAIKLDTFDGITFPDGAIITGLSFDITCMYSVTGSGTLVDSGVQLLLALRKDGVANPVASKIITIHSKSTTITAGGVNDLWGTTWTKDELNKQKMAIEVTPVGPFASSGTVSVTFSLDLVTRNVHFRAIDDTNPAEFPEAPRDSLSGGPEVVDYIDGYFVVNRPDTQQFFFSALGDGKRWDGLDVGSKEGQPDNLATLIVNYRELWLLGNQTSEVWWNSGDPDNPFQRFQGAFIENGIAAVGTLKKLLSSVIWVSQDRNGNPMVLRAIGHQPVRISTYPLEQKLKTFPEIAKATAYAYQSGGHGFYCLNVPGADTTFVYDVSTSLWHDRQSVRASGLYGRHRAENCVSYKGRIIVGDFENHNIYELDDNTYTDAGQVIPRIRRAPHVSKNGKPFILGSVHLDAANGRGNSEALLRISKDYGNTWSSEKSSIAKIGEYLKRFVWRQLGQARDFAIEVKILSDGPVTLISLFLNE